MGTYAAKYLNRQDFNPQSSEHSPDVPTEMRDQLGASVQPDIPATPQLVPTSYDPVPTVLSGVDHGNELRSRWVFQLQAVANVDCFDLLPLCTVHT